jgi:hypothetical protein
MSPGKKEITQKRVTNLDDFQRDEVFSDCMTVEYFPTAKKLTLELRRKINYRGSVP